MEASHNFTVEISGERLDRFIGSSVDTLSRSQAQKLIEEGYVLVNNAPVKASYRLEKGDIVELVIPPAAPSELTPEAIPLKIIYEDDDLLVIDKPPGLAVHPGPGNPSHTLANAVLNYLPSIATGEPGRPGIVHRLDKDTSGLIIVARNPQAHQYLTGQFKQREVKKTYITLVNGRLSPMKGFIEAPIGRDRVHRQRMTITEENKGRQARTGYRVMQYFEGYSLLEINPETGRTHQIRVHLAAIGHSVVGDTTYGKASLITPRQFLHAHKLKFKLPSSGQYVEFISPLPDDLKQSIDIIST